VTSQTTVNRGGLARDRRTGRRLLSVRARPPSAVTAGRRQRRDRARPRSSRPTTTRSHRPGVGASVRKGAGAVAKALELARRDATRRVYPLLIDYALATGLAHEASGSP